ncbi:hypothetical protein GH714_010709 [Hevea brasiliensis]|uniref:Glycosyltransferase n=1 Tax=Hevea brasiliensis TaxID=3981 RepID=A0A6A6M6V0_HEVBR|nr:hypothetical protein GH714_010709 [Hevea brasiliensis]
MADYASCDFEYHVILFPFMSKGHTIPILQLARLLLRRRIAVTIFTTPANHPFIGKSLTATTAARIIVLHFPHNVPGIPCGIESTDKLPSMSLFPSFALSTKLLQPDFERALETLQHVNFMVSDGFLWWTLESAMKFRFPRLVFYGMNNYSVCLSRAVREDGILFGPESSDDEMIAVTRFPWIKVTRSNFEQPFADAEPKAYFEFIEEAVAASKRSYGYIINSFYELEPVFVDFFNIQNGPKAWCVGPLCLAEPLKSTETSPHEKPTWIQWLDKKLEQERSVLYVAFGTQGEISSDQLREIAIGLENSKANFFWVMRNKKSEELGNGFEERVQDRGIVIRDWVDQREILEHQSVQGFLSHCGWNSVLDSICAGVPILAWPMMAEQPLNARMVVEEIKVGLRVETCRGFVKGEELAKTVRELIEGERGKEVMKKVKEYAEKARKAVEEGTGSSWQTLDILIDETCRK